jgi:sugar lactone lactonase YvrE
VAFDAAGNLFVANWGNSIVKFAPNGTSSIFATAGLNHPGGLAFDAFGNLFVSNTGNNTILKYSPGGQVSVFVSAGLNGPKDLAFDSSGNLYVVDSGNYAIDKFTPAGVKSILATTGTEAPWFIAIQPGLQVPEPSAATLLVLGSMSLAFTARKASNRKKAEQGGCTEPGEGVSVAFRASLARGR